MSQRLALVCIGFTLLCMFGGCKKQSIADTEMCDSISFHYASLIKIYIEDSCKVVEIRNPWKVQEYLHRYVLVEDSQKIPARFQGMDIVRIPLKKACIGTSVHAALIKDLGAEKRIHALCDAEYILSPYWKSQVAQGKVETAGSSQNINIELLLAHQCDAIWLSPYEQMNYGTITQAKIPIIECADYMEDSWLGRAEWMKFYGLLMGCEKQADSLFSVVEKNYLQLKDKVKESDKRPTVFCDKMRGEVWFQPGGSSTMGQILSDAGMDYVFAENDSRGSVNYDFETVFTHAYNADIWLIKYGLPRDLTYSALREENLSYSKLKTFKERNVWGCNMFKVAFSEEVPFHPDKLLKDLISIAHPEIISDSLRYYYSALHE